MMEIPLFDGHCDTVFRLLNEEKSLRKNDLHLDLSRIARCAPYAQFFAIWDTPEACACKDVFSLSYNKLIHELSVNGDLIVLCTTAKQARKAFDSGRSAAFISIEGAHLIGCDPVLLDKAYALGVRAMNLTWNNANSLSGSHCADLDRGLSSLGRDFVRRCNQLGIILDVSHLSQPGFWDVVAMTSSPVIASHSNAGAVCGHTRNISDEQFRAIQELDGVVGMNLYTGLIGGTTDLAQLMKHILHFLERGGARNLSIGTDFDGCDSLCQGISGVQDIRRIYDALLNAGIAEKIAEDIFFNNLMRVVGKVCVM
jgi:membrane dipeptidase